MQSGQRYCVVVPAYNEAKNIIGVITRLRGQKVQVVVVDDGSSDHTARTASTICKHVLRHELNLGKGAAMKTGCEYAFGVLGAKGVIFFDADGQHHPNEIHKFVEALDRGHELVFGIRELSSRMPWTRVVGNKALSAIVALFFGAYIPDILSGFKALSLRGYRRVLWDAQGYDVETEIVVRSAVSKLPYVQIPISTIYNKLDRGMTIADAVSILPRLIEWRIML